jgi:hypothetical protein
MRSIASLALSETSGGTLTSNCGSRSESRRHLVVVGEDHGVPVGGDRLDFVG